MSDLITITRNELSQIISDAADRSAEKATQAVVRVMGVRVNRKQAAAALQVTPKTITRQINSGRLPTPKNGNFAD